MDKRRATAGSHSKSSDDGLSRWDSEGGAGPQGPRESSRIDKVDAKLPLTGNVELAQLRIRIIALENLVITLLAQGSQRDLGLAHKMAAYISPRPGFTHHPVTVRAAAQMKNMVDRAGRFREKTLGKM
jgi:hypothetical protein